MKNCMDCGADLSHRGANAKRCEPCVVIANKARQQTPSYLAYKKAYGKAYCQTPEYKARRQTPEYKARRNAQRRSPKWKAYDKARRKTPEYRAYQRERQKERYHKMGGKDYRRAWPELLLRDGPVCGICGEHLDPIREAFEVDHIVPVSKGGTSDLSNLQLAHPACNNAKHATWDGTAPSEPPAQLGLFA